MSNQVIEVDLGKILERIEQKLDNLQKDVTAVQITLAEVKVEVQNIKEDVRELKSTYKWVIGLIVTLGVGVGVLILNAFNLISTKT